MKPLAVNFFTRAALEPAPNNCCDYLTKKDLDVPDVGNVCNYSC